MAKILLLSLHTLYAYSQPAHSPLTPAASAKNCVLRRTVYPWRSMRSRMPAALLHRSDPGFPRSGLMDPRLGIHCRSHRTIYSIVSQTFEPAYQQDPGKPLPAPHGDHFPDLYRQSFRHVYLPGAVFPIRQPIFPRHLVQRRRYTGHPPFDHAVSADHCCPAEIPAAKDPSSRERYAAAILPERLGAPREHPQPAPRSFQSSGDTGRKLP